LFLKFNQLNAVSIYIDNSYNIKEEKGYIKFIFNREGKNGGTCRNFPPKIERIKVHAMQNVSTNFIIISTFDKILKILVRVPPVENTKKSKF
jgi:hypothetical protein